MEESKKQSQNCEICGENATNICLDCLNYFCKKCSNFVHSNNLNKDHKIEKIDFYVKLHTKCKIHPKFPINIFCLDEKSKNY